MVIGINFARSFAAIRIPLYPAQVLIEVSASRFCALEIRGTPSRVRAITPFAAIFLTISWLTGEAG